MQTQWHQDVKYQQKNKKKSKSKNKRQLMEWQDSLSQRKNRQLRHFRKKILERLKLEEIENIN
ncbi:MAG: hypothetical protein GXO93_05120 [FCB group bacterium]|nr:hypothetical protein [FCB group bacterium]